jgi:hypothetical protein
MARWEYIKLYYYHYEDPENSFGIFTIQGPNGQYVRKEIRDLEQAFTQLEQEGWKIDKVTQPSRLIDLGRPEAVKWQEIFQLTRHIE